ncbi:MAG: hypothetical protein AAGC88_16585, partial [Bacteroidota bacterium]
MGFSFDKHGHLLPYSIIKIKLDQFKDTFVNSFPHSHSRSRLFDNYQHFISDFQQQITSNFTQWIDGSFVTQKQNPRDIDFLTFIDHTIYEEKEISIDNHFRLAGARKKYGVDAYTIRAYPKTHKKNMLFESDMVYWHNLFGQTKKNRSKKKFRKGVVELVF